MTTSIYTVTGMTCQHCVASVTSEVSRLDHITAVEVDLDTGIVTVESSESIPEQVVLDAIKEAGYSAKAS